MMLLTKKLASKFLRNQSKIGFHRNIGSIIPAVGVKLQEEAEPRKKVKKASFLDKIFVGKFDNDFLIYPEVLTDKELKDINEKTAGVNETKQGNLNFEDYLKTGILRLGAPVEYGGVETKCTRLIKTIESLNLEPSEALLLDVSQSLVIETISRYGSEKQKEKYLPRLLTGEWKGAYAMTEEVSGSDPSIMETMAELTYEDENNYALNGEKVWVTNGKNADVIIVFSKIKENKRVLPNELVVLLVDKTHPGISYSDKQAIGLERCEITNIKFENVLVSTDSALTSSQCGFDIAAHCLKTPKYFTPICIFTKLKQLLSDCCAFVDRRKQSLISLKECEHIKSKIAQVAMTLYSMESMLYLLAGMKDQFEFNGNLEFLLIEVYCYERCLKAFKKCLDIFGSKSYDLSFPYSKFLNDVHGIIQAAKTLDLMKLFLTLSTLETAGRQLSEDIKKSRNPFNFPGFIVKRMIETNRQQKDNPKLTLQLYMNLHPSLKESAEQLEYCIARLQFAVETLLSRHGTAIVDRQFELLRLADISMDIFAMTSVISRASRSYCTGIKNCDDELFFAKAICMDGSKNVKAIVNDIVQGAFSPNDFSHLKIGTKVINEGKLFLEHPTVRNIE